MTLEDLLQIALGALADIGWAEDLDEAGRRAKAKRIYNEITSSLDSLTTQNPVMPPPQPPQNPLVTR